MDGESSKSFQESDNWFVSEKHVVEVYWDWEIVANQKDYAEVGDIVQMKCRFCKLEQVYVHSYLFTPIDRLMR